MTKYVWATVAVPAARPITWAVSPFGANSMAPSGCCAVTCQSWFFVTYTVPSASVAVSPTFSATAFSSPSPALLGAIMGAGRRLFGCITYTVALSETPPTVRVTTALPALTGYAMPSASTRSTASLLLCQLHVSVAPAGCTVVPFFKSKLPPDSSRPSSSPGSATLSAGVPCGAASGLGAGVPPGASSSP